MNGTVINYTYIRSDFAAFEVHVDMFTNFINLPSFHDKLERKEFDKNKNKMHKDGCMFFFNVKCFASVKS